IWRIGWVSGYKTRKIGWIRNHDVIFYYTKSSNYTFNKIYIPYTENYVRRDGKKPTGEGIPIEDTWNCSSADVLDSIMIKSFSKEKLGFPTQKPVALLERIIKTSSNEGDIVLDPFCGCGTALDASEKLHRQWIGIDITHIAIHITKKRLTEKYPDVKFEVIGEPKDLECAKEFQIY
ncbi:MAG: DNA-methyltransferase, partial [Thermoplasmata archaeon]